MIRAMAARPAVGIGHEDALPALREAVTAGPPAGRFWRRWLYVARDKAALPELLAAARTSQTVSVKTQPKWQTQVRSDAWATGRRCRS